MSQIFDALQRSGTEVPGLDPTLGPASDFDAIAVDRVPSFTVKLPSSGEWSSRLVFGRGGIVVTYCRGAAVCKILGNVKLGCRLVRLGDCRLTSTRPNRRFCHLG